MLNIFKNKSDRMVEETFSLAADYQKFSAINFLIGVSGVDSTPNTKEEHFIQKYAKLLRVTIQISVKRLETYGSEQVFSDLKQLNTQQKEILFRMAVETAYADDDINLLEQAFIESNFTTIGLSVLDQRQILRSADKYGKLL